MPISSNAQQDRSARLEKRVRSSVPWSIVQLDVLPDFALSVEFIDGVSGTVHMSNYVHAEDAGVFVALRDPEIFSQAFLNDGVVNWPGELDIAPDAMYDEILANGKWVL